MGIKDHALGEKMIKEILKQANWPAPGFDVPYQELMAKGRD